MASASGPPPKTAWRSIENGKWKVYGTADGLAHRAVLSWRVDKRTGDVWAATMGGLSRFSAGRFDNFTQLNSGLPNDVVYGVAVQGDFVWAATAAGAGRLNTRTGQWSLFNERNTPDVRDLDLRRQRRRRQGLLRGLGRRRSRVRREDRALERLQRSRRRNRNGGLKDQGLIHEITTSVSYAEKDKILWVATYFGASRYDGRNWKNFLEKDSGLPSNFLNQVKAVDGNRAWFSTDKGLAYFDGENWAVYRRARHPQAGDAGARRAGQGDHAVPMDTAPAHHYILGVDFQGDDIWVATAKGLSHGIRIIQTERY